MIIDKVNKADLDFLVTPLPRWLLTLSYVLSNLISTLIVSFALLGIGLIYLSAVGFYLSFLDVLLIAVDIVLTSAFACLLANLIWSFTRSQGVNSAICALISALYGFICGAYMPLSSMGEAVRNFTSLLPGTYSTVLFRNHFLNGALEAMGETLPGALVAGIGDGFDVSFAFFGHSVPLYAMYLVIGAADLLMLGLFVLIACWQGKRARK